VRVGTFGSEVLLEGSGDLIASVGFCSAVHVRWLMMEIVEDSERQLVHR